MRESFFFPLETLERKHSADREELAELRATIKSMDREKDELQQQVDEKTEDVMNLEAIKITLVRDSSFSLGGEGGYLPILTPPPSLPSHNLFVTMSLVERTIEFVTKNKHT